MSFILERNSKGTLTTFSYIGNQAKSQLENYKTKQFRNDKNLTFCEYKSLVFQTIFFICNFLNLILTLIYADKEHLIEHDQQIKELQDLMLFSSISSSFFYLFCALQNFNVQALNKGDRINNYWKQPSQLIKIIIISAVLLFHPSSLFLTGQEQEDILINNTLSILSYTKIVYVYIYFGSRVGRLLRIYGYRKTATNLKYAIKCLFKQRGFISNIFLFLLAIVFLGVVYTQLSTQDDMFLDGIYTTLVTMTSVGYGQITPSDNLTRSILFMVILIGSLASSLSTLVFLSSLQLTPQQHKSYRIINRLQAKHEIERQKKKITQMLPLIKKSKNHAKINQQIKQIGRRCKQKQKEMKVDKQPLYELINNQYRYFFNKLKILIQNQILCDNLLSFYFNRIEKQENSVYCSYSFNKSVMSLKSHRKRIEDSAKYYSIKQKILQ